LNDHKFRPTSEYDDRLQKRADEYGGIPSIADECQVDVPFGTNQKSPILFGTNKKKGRILNIEAVVEGFWGSNYEPPTRNSCKRKAALSTASSGRRKKSPRHSLVTTEGVLRASESDSGDNGEEDEGDLDELSDNDEEEYEEEQINVDQLDPFSIGDELAEFDDEYDQDMNRHLLENPHLDLLLINDLVDELPGFDYAEDLFPTFCETHVIVESRNVRNPKYELGGIFDNGKFAGVIERLDYDSNELSVRVSQHYSV